MTASARRVISVRGLSKLFRIYSHPIDLLKEAITGKPRHSELWGLRDVTFEIGQGEVVGIVGRNGAGKSTLLKILTGTLDATSGNCEVSGKVAAILELGTGFNPEFSGLENVYLGGLCLGMSRKEIDAKLDDIIAFSELESYINHPFKTYSSGMKSRLTFATAMSVNPDILIIDEALSVGDAKFQRKCFAKISEFRQHGKTILIVSHDTNTITSFCDRAILLDQGLVMGDGTPGEITKQYLEILFGKGSELDEQSPHVEPESAGDALLATNQEIGISKLNPSPPQPVSVVNLLSDNELSNGQKTGYVSRFQPAPAGERRFGTGQAEIWDCGILDGNGRRVDVLESGRPYTFFQRIIFHESVPPVSAGYLIRNVKGVDVFGITNTTQGIPIRAQTKGDVLETRIEVRMWLAAGDYFLTVGVARLDGLQFDLRNDTLYFTVVGTPHIFTTSLVNLDAKFFVENVSSRASAQDSPCIRQT